ncbi:PP2C family protein-serine/threonine phosphatase [Mycobacterium sp. shizuoka-1]|uniref:PP2C family protein-serine/threonine phosphatase n=1 Tax=Mycobacterium sp. shizuoka-1 TaxID=2039281 RepID=UPI000C05F7C5|nr:GAF domain-containing SpoIIE family protein phosphatase [Mycobacterium sp. shizuoka-1]GAY16249.1 hypothetical protein MSZK_29750 [Mycobacterium sp. shizuoka-1]
MSTQFCIRTAETDENERLQALHRYAILDTPPDDAFNRITRVAARALGKPVAAISFVDRDRVWFKAIHGAQGPHEIPREAGLCALAISDSRTYLVRDTAADPYLSQNGSAPAVFGVRFYAAAPITTADGHQLGTVSVLDTVPGDVTADQLAILEDLAAIVMTELELRLSALTTVRAERELRENAERNEATTLEYATVLQRALLPSALPQIPGLSMAAHYHPAASGQVGGDFYDVFGVAPDRWAFFLGDVEGHGAPAAAVTALVRHTLRAAALHHDDATAGLHELNTALISDPGERRFCTVLSGTLQPEEAGFHVTLATGGHLPALLLDPEAGSIRPVRSSGGMLIGAVADATFEACEMLLGPGQTLLLYTDGIVEARPDGTTTFGESALRLFLSERAGLPATALIAELAELAATLRPDDDVAFLALTVAAAPAGEVG